MTPPPDLSTLSHAEKDALIASLFARLAEALDRIAALEAQSRGIDQASEDPRQLVQTAFTRAENQSSGACGRSPSAQEPAWRGADAASEPGSPH